MMTRLLLAGAALTVALAVGLPRAVTVSDAAHAADGAADGHASGSEFQASTAAFLHTPREVPAALDETWNPDAAVRGNADPRDLDASQIRRWAARDPRDAAAWVTAQPDGPTSQGLIRQVALAWAEADLEQAVAWVQSLPESPARTAATLDLVYEAARSAPASARELAVALPASPARDEALVHVVRQWAAVSPAEATTWARQFDDAALRPRLIESVAVVLANSEPAAAVDLTTGALAGDDRQLRASMAILTRWAGQEPATEDSWRARFGDRAESDQAAGQLVALWTARDRTSAGAWAHALPEGDLRNLALAVIESEGSRDEPSHP